VFLQIGPPACHRAPSCTSVKAKLNAAHRKPDASALAPRYRFRRV
jgi:hypothetical protein